MGLLASLLGSWGGVAAADAAQAGGFCQAEFPQVGLETWAIGS